VTRRIAWSEADQMTNAGALTIERFMVCKSSIGDARRILMLLSLIQMIRAVLDYQCIVAELSQFTDRELADIGLNRADIPRVAGGNHDGRSALFRTER
jgi:uncharacterized protein YjiS (DUF1127 family)